MNIVQVRTFVAIVDSGSFSAAARKLGISQPGITLQMRALEDELGQSLLDRRYRKIEITEAGRTLLPYARKLLAAENAALDSLRGLDSKVAGPLVVSASTTPGDYVIPPLLGEFVAAYPDVLLTMRVGSTQSCIELVEEGAADIGICGAKLKGRTVDFAPCGGDELVVLCPPGHALADRKRGVDAAAAFPQEPWVMRDENSGTHRSAMACLREAGVNTDALHTIVELATGEAVVAAVEGGLGLAIVSGYVATKALRLSTVSRVPIAGQTGPDGHTWHRPFYLTLPHRTLPRPAQAFQTFLQEKLAAPSPDA